MVEIGDTKIRKYPRTTVKLTFTACKLCGKGYWSVNYTYNKTKGYCRACSIWDSWRNPEIRERRTIGLQKAWDDNFSRKIETANRYKGSGNPFYGKTHTQEVRDIYSQPRVHIKVKQTKDWGYLIGLVLGDGCLDKTHNSYKVTVASSKPEIVDAFYDVCQKLKLHCNNIKSASGEHYYAEVCSKELYLFLRPYKQDDFHWGIPKMVNHSKDMTIGFLQGLYDAEGGVYHYKYGDTIEVYSKHVENLLPVKDILQSFGIQSNMLTRHNRKCSKIFIGDYTSRIRFRDAIGFRLERKEELLNNMRIPEKHIYTANQYEKVMKLLSRHIPVKDIVNIVKLPYITIYNWANGKIPSNLKYLNNEMEVVNGK